MTGTPTRSARSAATTGSRDASAPRGSAGRVAVVQRQARRTLGLGAAFAVAATVALVVPHRTGAWLSLHLFLVGAVLLAISAATQLFAVTWAAGPPPADRVAAVQRGLLAAGATLLAAARELQWPDELVATGGALVIAALIVLGVSLGITVAGGVQRRFDVAAGTYLVALAAGVIGCALGISMATGLDASTHAEVRAAHLTLNLLGLVGLVIAGTLPSFTATQARVKMSKRSTGPAPRVVLVWLTAALAVAAIGFLVDEPVLAAAGLGAYAAGIVGVAALLPAVGAKQLRWAGPRLLQLGAGIAWWVGATVTVAWQAGTGRDVFTPAVIGVLVVGGYAQVLVASVAYLGPVLRAGGHEQLRAGFRTTRSWFGLAVANVAAVAFTVGAFEVATAAIVLWVVDTAARAAVLVLGARSRAVSARTMRAPMMTRRTP